MSLLRAEEIFMSGTLDPLLQFSSQSLVRPPVHGDPATLLSFVAQNHPQETTRQAFTAYLDYSTDLANAQLKFNKALQAAVAKANS
jgi:hypothetical protein